MACKPKTLRNCVVRGFSAAYHWEKDPSEIVSKNKPVNPYEYCSERWYAWNRGFDYGCTIRYVEQIDKADRAALERQRLARCIVNDTDPNLQTR